MFHIQKRHKSDKFKEYFKKGVGVKGNGFSDFKKKTVCNLIITSGYAPSRPLGALEEWGVEYDCQIFVKEKVQKKLGMDFFRGRGLIFF